MTFKFKGKIGFCIGQDFERTDKDILKKLADYGTPLLADGLNRFNCMDEKIKPIAPGIKIAGNALTLRLRPADNLMMHKAVALAQEGDIIVVDTCGCKNFCVLGDLIASAAFKKKIGGIVIDGAVRDIVELRERSFPIFAKYVVNAVGDKDGPGEINMPISCAGVPVLPGDIIVGDDNGVVALRPEFITEIIQGAEKKLAYEKNRAAEIEAGIISKPDIDEKLKYLGII